MTDHKELNIKLNCTLSKRQIGKFRLSDIIDNPPANLGKKFRKDVVVNKIYPNIKRIGSDRQSVIYEKF